MEQTIQPTSKLSGKKKLIWGGTPVLITILNTVIAAYVPAELRETTIGAVGLYLPTMVAWVMGILGMNREARVDVEREKTKQIVANHAPAAPVRIQEPPKPTRINFTKFLREVDDRCQAKQDERPEPVEYYQELIVEGKQWFPAVLQDVLKFNKLVLNAAYNKFEAKHGFRTDDPKLDNIIKTKGTCPYSSLDAFVAYEGVPKMLDDVLDHELQERQILELIELDTAGAWTRLGDNSLYGAMEGANIILGLFKSGRLK